MLTNRPWIYFGDAQTKTDPELEVGHGDSRGSTTSSQTHEMLAADVAGEERGSDLEWDSMMRTQTTTARIE